MPQNLFNQLQGPFNGQPLKTGNHLKTKDSKDLFQNDEAISHYTDDLLNRKAFAAELARSITNWKCKKSLVIGLNGAWGSGKSSLKSMIKLYVQEQNPAFQMVDFNPWEWTGHADLRQSLFSELYKELNKHDHEKQSKAAAKSLKIYSDYFDSASHFSGIFAIALTAFVTVGAGCIAQNSITWLLALIVFSAVLTRLFKSFKTLLFSISQAFNSDLRTLNEIRTDLEADLKSLPNPVLIIIDELDRLSKDEILAVFQLVKANLNFSNLIFFLLYDGQALEQSYSEEKRLLSKEYMSKIIQVEFIVPAISSQQLKDYLKDQILATLNGSKVRQQFEEDRWERFFQNAGDFFKTLRDAKRVLNSFQFHLGLFRTENSVEVNPIDLFAIETIRIFCSAVYLELFSEKSMLAPPFDQWAPTNGRKFLFESLTPNVNKIFRNCHSEKKVAVKAVLGELFPSLASYLTIERNGNFDTSTTLFNIDEDTSLRNLRICHPEIFDRYFYLSMPSQGFLSATVSEIIDNINDVEQLKFAFQESTRTGSEILFVQQLTARRAEIEIKHVPILLGALFDFGDFAEKADTNAFRLEATTLIFGVLRAIPSPETRFEIFSKGFALTRSIYLPIVTVLFLDADLDGHSSLAWGIVEDEADLQKFKDLILRRIEHSAQSDCLLVERQLSYLLQVWQEWDKEAASKWAKKQLDKQDSFIHLLKAYRHREPTAKFYYSELFRLISKVEIRNAISALSFEKLAPDEIAMIELFESSQPPLPNQQLDP